MTDPTLAALLADPEPDARLFAADWLEERGREIEAAACRVLAIHPRLWKPLVGHGWLIQILHPSGGVELRCWPNRIHFESEEYTWSVGREWLQRVPQCKRRQRRRAWEPCTPPLGLEAAVLAVLAARPAEVRQG